MSWFSERSGHILPRRLFLEMVVGGNRDPMMLGGLFLDISHGAILWKGGWPSASMNNGEIDNLPAAEQPGDDGRHQRRQNVDGKHQRHDRGLSLMRLAPTSVASAF